VIPWIHVEDAASATVAALERARPGEVYNVVDDEAVTVGEFAAELARGLGAKGPRSVPWWMARATASFAARFFTEARLRVSNAKAKRDLGWAPSFPTYREGLRALTAAPV
jgi:nucleoside-diphosphate-sugar epimerase